MKRIFEIALNARCYTWKITLPTPPFLWCQTCHPDNLQRSKENPSIQQRNHQSVFYPQTHTRHFRFIVTLKRKKLDEFFLKIHAFDLIHDLQILIKTVLFLGNIGRHSISVSIPCTECRKFCKSFVKLLGDIHVFTLLYAVLHKFSTPKVDTCKSTSHYSHYM